MASTSCAWAILQPPLFQRHKREPTSSVLYRYRASVHWLVLCRSVLQVPAVQAAVVQKCRELNKPVIVASQLLESMIEFPTPTRAEVRS